MRLYHLNLILHRADGALARIIGVAEHRGYRPVGVDGEARSEGDRWYLRLAVESERPIENLCAQLEKLHDCLRCEVAG